eukprot:UN33927
MQGSQVYLARGVPTVDEINKLSSWEFWNGKSYSTGDAKLAKPIIEWANRTGVVTMTYVHALKKFITCISTSSHSPF